MHTFSRQLVELPSRVRTTDQTLSCAARAHVATAARRTACLHVSRAMQAARRRPVFDFTRRLGRRAEAGPRQLLRQVRRRSLNQLTETIICSLARVSLGEAFSSP